MKRSFSIRTYLGLSYALLLVISIGTIGFIWSRNEYEVITREFQLLMRDRATVISDIISHELEEHDQFKFERAEYSIENFSKDSLVVYIDNSGSVHDLIPGSISPRQAELFLNLSQKFHTGDQSLAALVRMESEPTNIYAAAPVLDKQNQSAGEVSILMPIGELDSYILRLRWMLGGAILVVALLGVVISILLTNNFSHHFTHALELASTVAQGNYHLRIPERGPTELRELSHYLNVMAEKLQEQLKTRQSLLANVSHELVRPLAGLELGIESLRKGAIQEPDLADDLLVEMGQTTRRLEDLIDDITLAAQPETLPIKLDRKPLAVEPFLKGVATRFWSLAESLGTKIEVRVDPDLPPVFADEKRLNQIIGNLMDNAVKFTPRGKVIRLSAELADEGHVRLMVRDGGTGIPPEEAEHLFEPFFQGGMGLRNKQGMGLGLSIAHQLAQAHGGSLTLENHPAGGAVAILTLPVADA